MKKTEKNSLIYGIVLVLFVFLTRYIFFANENTEFSSDTGHYAIASQFYSIADYAPHLPGYFLYVKLIKLVSYLTGTPQSAMIWLSLFFSSAAALLLFRIVRNYVDDNKSFLLTLLIFTNPFVWFYGCVYEIYSFDLFFSVLLIFAALNNKWIYTTPPLLAMGMGVRLTSGILLLPVLIYLWYNHNKKEGIYWFRFFEFSSLGLVLLLMWAIPMIRSSGGVDKYFALYNTHYPFIALGPLYNLANFIGNAWYILVPFGLLLIFFIIRLSNDNPVGYKTLKEEYGKELLTIFYWLVPALIVFVFFNYMKGYFLLAVGSFFLMYVIFAKYDILKNKVIIALIVIQAALFFFMPYNEPSDELNFNEKARTFGKFDAWTERMTSGFSMGLNRLSSYNAYYNDIYKGIIESREYMVQARKFFYFLDPSCLVFARGLQAKFPSKTFTVLNNYDMTTYFSYNEYELRKTTDPYYMIKNSIIITRKSFYEKYLKGIAEPIKEYDTYVFLDGNEINGLKLLDLYSGLYSESNN